MSILGERMSFVLAVREAFDSAGVDYAFLHNVFGDEQADSDVDVVVSRESLAAVEAVVRGGALGRLVQRLDYDIPWCRYYVLDTGDSMRRYRQLDVACDPLGVSRYGPALATILDTARVVDGSCVPSVEGRFLYLVTKRSQKGIRDERDAEQLTRAWGESPVACRQALVVAFGELGLSAAAAMNRHDVSAAVRCVAIAVEQTRKAPATRLLRAAFTTHRAGRRLIRPTGLVVALAGPDGAGKSTLAEGLERDLAGAFRRTARLHLTPGVLPPPARLLGRYSGETTNPQGRRPSGTVGSLARVVYLAADTLAGWLPSVSAPKVRSTLVVLERGWSDLRVDPLRYRLSAGRRLVAALDRVLPHPDVRLLLAAPPAAIRQRKPELGETEIARQLEAWRRLGASTEIPALDPDDTRATAVECVNRHLSARVGDLSAFGTALKTIGAPRATGTPYRIVTAGGRPRWLLPVDGPGPRGARLYRPAGLRRTIGAVGLEAAQRIRMPGAITLTLDAELGLAPELAALLGRRRVQLAALLPTDPARADRTVLSVLDGNGAVLAMAKVAPADSHDLGNERATLLALEAVPTSALRAPRVHGWFAWQGFDVLVEEALPLVGRTDRGPGEQEVAALAELARLGAPLGLTLVGRGSVAVHGDFCAWNTSSARKGLAVWDWEWAHLGEPLEDWFHWRLQRLVHFGKGDEEDLLRAATTPTSREAETYRRLGATVSSAPGGLAAALRSGLARLSDTAVGPERSIRERMLARAENGA